MFLLKVLASHTPHPPWLMCTVGWVGITKGDPGKLAATVGGGAHCGQAQAPGSPRCAHLRGNSPCPVVGHRGQEPWLTRRASHPDPGAMAAAPAGRGLRAAQPSCLSSLGKAPGRQTGLAPVQPWQQLLWGRRTGNWALPPASCRNLLVVLTHPSKGPPEVSKGPAESQPPGVFCGGASLLLQGPPGSPQQPAGGGNLSIRHRGHQDPGRVGTCGGPLLHPQSLP